MSAKQSAFVRCVLLGTAVFAVAGCGSNSGPFPSVDPSSILSIQPPSPTANTLMICSVASEAEKTVNDIYAGSATAVSELQQLFLDAKSLASKANAVSAEPVYLDASGLSSDAYNLSHSDTGTSSAQLQDSPEFIQLSTDATALGIDGGC
jgi:hypothetical protein